MRKLVILVVDDEEEIRNLFFRHLEKKGFLVYLAGSIEEERKILKNVVPDLIFLDINLPDGNGLEELQRTKVEDFTQNIVIMSAFDHQEDRKQAFDLGALDFLSKPFSLSRLNQVIDSRFKTPSLSTNGNGPDSSN